MEYRKLNNDIYALKVSIGEKIRESINTVVEENNITFAKIEGVGAIKDVTIGFLKENGEYDKKTFTEDVEMISMKGSVAGEREVHLHASLGREDFSVVGGHFFEGEVIGVAEIFITVLTDKKVNKKQFANDKFPTWQLN